jgi:hypothetical protein
MMDGKKERKLGGNQLSKNCIELFSDFFVGKQKGSKWKLKTLKLQG